MSMSHPLKMLVSLSCLSGSWGEPRKTEVPTQLPVCQSTCITRCEISRYECDSALPPRQEVEPRSAGELEVTEVCQGQHRCGCPESRVPTLPNLPRAQTDTALKAGMSGRRMKPHSTLGKTWEYQDTSLSQRKAKKPISL